MFLSHLLETKKTTNNALNFLKSALKRVRIWQIFHFGVYPDVAWDTYCPLNRLENFIGEIVTTCGLVVEQRTHHQVTGEPMKFLSIADWTSIVETELFAKTYKSYGLATVRYPVLEIEAKVEPFENKRGFSLHVLRAGKPRCKHN